MGEAPDPGAEWGGRDPDKPLAFETTMDRAHLTEWAAKNPDLPEDPDARAAKIKEDVDLVMDLGYTYEQWMKIMKKPKQDEEGEH